MLRGDSGFATSFLYKQCETNGTSYAIRLKENKNIRSLASDIEDHLFGMIHQDEKTGNKVNPDES